MTFQETLAHVITWLQHEQRVSYRALKRQFALDDAYLEDLKDELIYAKKLAMDEEGRVLVWTGGVASASPPAVAERAGSGLWRYRRLSTSYREAGMECGDPPG